MFGGDGGVRAGGGFQEVSKAREYARTLPLHVWTATRPRHPKHFCMCNNGHAEPEEHAAEDE
eukprot:3589041-Rhodomonas_salina.2